MNTPPSPPDPPLLAEAPPPPAPVLALDVPPSLLALVVSPLPQAPMIAAAMIDNDMQARTFGGLDAMMASVGRAGASFHEGVGRRLIGPDRALPLDRRSLLVEPRTRI